ncbi:MAG: ketopantoate reductase family protein [Burkholderiaceae bacterium]
MRLLVIGAGAMGGYLAARLGSTGHEVSVVARGAHLEAMRRAGGLVLVEPDAERRFVPMTAYADTDDAPAADVVMVTLKAHQVTAMRAPIARAAARASMLVVVHNGVGWWYFRRGASGPFAGRTVASVDPDGTVAATLPDDKVVPLFCFKSAEVIEPGVVLHRPSASEQHLCGELDDAHSPRLGAFVDAMLAAGLPCRIEPVRAAMWTKWLGNIFANPLCALTGVPLGPAVMHPDGRVLALALMRECADVAAAHGVPILMSPEERLDKAARVKDVRPSMLQDRDAGRPMELDAILGGLVELGGLVGVEVPTTRTLLACLRVAQAHAGIATATPTP